MDFDLAEFDLNEPDFAAGEQKAYQEIDLFGLDENEVNQIRNLKDAVLFIIDCSASMAEQNKHNQDEQSNIEIALKALESFMKSKIIANDNDRIGILFYNTTKSSNSLEFKSIHQFQRLETIDAQRILQLQDLNKLVAKSNDKQFKLKFPPSKNQVPLHQLFWIANTELKSIEKLAFNKRIFLFTDQDKPNISSKHDQQRAIKRAQDLSELGVKIQLFPMAKPRDGKPNFDFKKFYTNVIFIDPQEEAELTQTTAISNKISQLNQKIRHKQFQKRIGGRCMLALSPNMNVGVEFYQMIRPLTIPSAIQLEAKTNRPLKSSTSYTCKELGQTLYENQIGYCHNYGGQKVPITRDDMKKIKNFDSSGLKLMGFKPKSKLKDYHNIRTSYFLYPDEKRIQGSGQVFDALIKRMIHNDKIAIVRFQPRTASMVRFCALVPQQQHIDQQDGFQTPEGFQLIFLPYANDIRSVQSLIQSQHKQTANQEEIDIAKNIVQQLSIDFNPRMFENPKIQNFYSTLQGIALKEEQPEEVEDLLQPNKEKMAQIEDAFAQLLGEFADEVMNAGDDYVTGKKKATKAPAKKKAAPKPKIGSGKHAIYQAGEGDQGEAEYSNISQKKKSAKAKPTKAKAKPKKKEQSQDDEEEIKGNGNGYDMNDDDLDLVDQMQTGELDQLTAAELKQIAKQRNLIITKKKKAQVLDIIKTYLKKNMKK